MWGAISEEQEFVECSCGFRMETDWIDDIVLTELEGSGHVRDFIIAYPTEPEEWLEQAFCDVGVVIDHDQPLEIAPPDLEWLLAQPHLPEGFRRAAAVHLHK
jgi:hypothetical protein